MTLDLDELERLEREATAGPWTLDADGCCVMLSDERGSTIQVAIGGSDGTEADARYIVALREAAPQLIAIARAAQTVYDDAVSRGIIDTMQFYKAVLKLCDVLPAPAEEKKHA